MTDGMFVFSYFGLHRRFLVVYRIDLSVSANEFSLTRRPPDTLAHYLPGDNDCSVIVFQLY